MVRRTFSDSASGPSGVPRAEVEDFHNPRRSSYLFLVTCSYLLVMWGEKGHLVHESA